MKTTTEDRMANPPHPGAFIRTEILEPLELSVIKGAEVLGVSRPALSNLLNGHADLSGDMALRIEKAFGVRMDTLLRMQASYDIARTREREQSITVRRYSHAQSVAVDGRDRRAADRAAGDQSHRRLGPARKDLGVG
jgi:addiction module HigA family antidote